MAVHTSDAFPTGQLTFSTPRRNPLSTTAYTRYLDPSGTDNHIVLIDVAGTVGLTGRQAEAALQDAGVVTNRNSIPADAHGAWYTSGIRLGTPALTTLGCGPAEMDEIADIITTALRATTAAPAPSGLSQARYILDDRVAVACRNRSADILGRFPLYRHVQL
jgi:glycine hydroxymethyltransferase